MEQLMFMIRIKILLHSLKPLLKLAMRASWIVFILLVSTEIDTCNVQIEGGRCCGLICCDYGCCNQPTTAAPSLDCCQNIDPCHGLPPTLVSDCTICEPLPNATTTCVIPNDSVNVPDVVHPSYDDEPVNFAGKLVDRNTGIKCSVSVISEHFLISACLRCLQEDKTVLPAERLQVILADFPQLDEDDSMELNMYDIKRILIHPGCMYQGRYDIKYDLGLIQTAESIVTSPDVGFATLPHSIDFQPDPMRIWIVSCMQPTKTSATSRGEALWYVQVHNIESKVCSALLNPHFYDEQSTVCVNYYHRKRRDLCQDDFGASLSYGKTLFGVLVHKYGCGTRGSVASFVNLGPSVSWIRKTVRELSGDSEYI